MGDLGELQRGFVANQSKPLSEVYSGYTYFADGDVLLAKITPCFENGKLGVARNLTNGVGFGSSEFLPLRCSDALAPEYLFYFLYRNEFREVGAKIMTGAVGHRRVPEEYLRQLPIPLPPIDEQHQIVAVLDKAFEGLAHARIHAVANLQNARELFAVTIEASLRQAGGVPLTLEELLERKWIISHLDGNHGSNYPRKEEFVAEGVPYISANCIEGNVIDLGRCKFLTPKRADTLRKGVAQNRDVIFAHNATVGPVALLTTEEPRVILSTSLTYYRCDESKVSPEFLVFAMRSAGFKRQYEAVMEQATRNQVPITMQRTFTHLIPSMGEQLKFAEAGIQIENDARELDRQYSQKLQDIDALRQSLLQQAFAGELT
jgi:type I restriction enzyme S subunit